MFFILFLSGFSFVANAGYKKINHDFSNNYYSSNSTHTHFWREFDNFVACYGSNYQRAFLDAAAYGYVDYLEPLLDLGARVNGYNTANGKTGLMYAAEHGHKMVCKQLLRLGAYVDSRTNWDSTALMWAAQSGHVEICRLLLDAGAYVNARTHFGKTAWSYASENGHTAVCNLLRNAGATKDAVYNKNKGASFGDCVFIGVAAGLFANWLLN